MSKEINTENVYNAVKLLYENKNNNFDDIANLLKSNGFDWDMQTVRNYADKSMDKTQMIEGLTGGNIATGARLIAMALSSKEGFNITKEYMLDIHTEIPLVKKWLKIIEENSIAIDPAKYAKRLMDEGAAIYEAKKFGTIIVRKGMIGETVTTYSTNGSSAEIEDRPIENDDQYIVTKADEMGNPLIDDFGHTNTWIMSGDTLNRKYEESGIDGIYKAKGTVQLFIQIPEDISISQWGVIENIKKGGFLNITDMNKVYGVSYQDFNNSYAFTENVSFDDMAKIYVPDNVNKNENKKDEPIK